MIPILTAALIAGAYAITPGVSSSSAARNAASTTPGTASSSVAIAPAREWQEPSIRRVQRMAVAYAGLDPLIIRGLRGRARLAPILPDIRFKIARVLDDGGRSGTDFDHLGTAHQVSATETRERQLRLEGELRWYPAEVVFRHEETKLVRESRHAAHERMQLLETVTRIYFDRRRAQLALASPDDLGPTARVSMMLDLQQLTAELDALTGGFFSHLSGQGNRN